MTDAAQPAPRAAFSARTMLALVAVGLVSFAGLAVLSAYAPDLREGRDPGANALSGSAVGLKGAVIMLKAEGTPVVVSRSPPRANRPGLLVLTPALFTGEDALTTFALQRQRLIVLPKWQTAPQPLHPGFVDKAGVAETTVLATRMLNRYAKASEIAHRPGVSRPVLHGVDGFGGGLVLPLGGVDRLQTLSGADWEPALVDERGGIVLARSRTQAGIFVLADPDLLNNQGLASLGTARAGMAVLDLLRDGRGVIFDVTLNGYVRGLGLGRLALEPPWLAATLCAVGAALLMGLHGLARFGPVRARDRAVALGKRALVDNSAGLVRMARREHELAPAYVALTQAAVLRGVGGERAAGGDSERWLADLARARGAAQPAELVAEAERAKTPDDLLAMGRKLYRWRREMLREG